MRYLLAVLCLLSSSAAVAEPPEPSESAALSTCAAALRERNIDWVRINSQYESLKEAFDVVVDERDRLTAEIAKLRSGDLESRKLALERKQLEAREDEASRAACARSTACTMRAECGFERGIGCTPRTDAHCRASKQCTWFGRCEFFASTSDDSGLCAATKDPDCKRSLFCKKDGKCTLNSDEGSCY